MRTASDVERYLTQSALPFQDLGDGLFLLGDAASSAAGTAIKVEDDVVVVQRRVLDAPAAGKEREALFERLLRLNGNGLLHAAFALQDDGIYLQAALPLSNLDQNELQAVLDDISMASQQYVPKLKGDGAN